MPAGARSRSRYRREERRRGPDGAATGGNPWRRNMRGPYRDSPRLARPSSSRRVARRVIMIPGWSTCLPALNDTRLIPSTTREPHRLLFPRQCPRGTFSEMLAHFLDGIVLPLGRRPLGRRPTRRPTVRCRAPGRPTCTICPHEALRLGRWRRRRRFRGAPVNVVFLRCVRRGGPPSLLGRAPAAIPSIRHPRRGWGPVTSLGPRPAIPSAANPQHPEALLESSAVFSPGNRPARNRPGGDAAT